MGWATHIVIVWALYQKCRTLLTPWKIESTVLQRGVRFQVSTSPPWAGLDWHSSRPATRQPDPCSSCWKWTFPLALHLVTPSRSFTKSRLTEELILIGSDRRGVWARWWSPSQPRLVSQKSEGSLPARPEPTMTHIPPSSFCLIFIGVWNNFQGAKRLVKGSLAVHVHATTLWISTFDIFFCSIRHRIDLK